MTTFASVFYFGVFVNNLDFPFAWANFKSSHVPGGRKASLDLY